MIDIIIFQAIFRKFAETGGIPLLAQNPHIHGWLQMIYSLPLCPPDLVEDECMTLLRDEVNLIAHDNDDLRAWLTNFLLYVDSTWITGTNYSIRDWNHFDSTTMCHLTNNSSGKFLR